MDGPVASEGGFPVRSKAFATDVGGVNTDFFYSVYADRILVVVTQVGTTGTIISARCGGGTAHQARLPSDASPRGGSYCLVKNKHNCLAVPAAHQRLPSAPRALLRAAPRCPPPRLPRPFGSFCAMQAGRVRRDERQRNLLYVCVDGSARRAAAESLRKEDCRGRGRCWLHAVSRAKVAAAAFETCEHMNLI